MQMTKRFIVGLLVLGLGVLALPPARAADPKADLDHPNATATKDRLKNQSQRPKGNKTGKQKGQAHKEDQRPHKSKAKSAATTAPAPAPTPAP